ncbi:hypothetical protein ACH4YO_02665 [Streptomyces noursei]|uniref:hypothetical protein n=1 Tax=Streptomyces noursei TaxID=1971 RepID=UPI0033D6D94D
MLTVNPLDAPGRALAGPLGEVVAGEEGVAGDEDDGVVAFGAEGEALCDEGGVAEPAATSVRGAEADVGPAVDDVGAACVACAVCVPYAARVAPVSATATAAAAFFALVNATAGPSNGIPAGMPVQR